MHGIMPALSIMGSRQSSTSAVFLNFIKRILVKVENALLRDLGTET